jgi:hypothetical protein
LVGLREQLEGGVFDYVMVKKSHALGKPLREIPSIETVYDGTEYFVVRTSAAVRAALVDLTAL